jgi:hypothetical protein
MAAIATDQHGFTIIEMKRGDEVDVDDSISWDCGLAMGSQAYTNQTKRKQIQIYVQNHGVSQKQLKQQLLL